MSAGSNSCSGRTSPTLTQVCLDMKGLTGSISALSENKDNCLPLKDGLRLQRKSCNKNRINPISHRKTRINSISKQNLTTIRPGPAVPPPYDMTTDCVVANHFVPPAKICADDDDQDVSSDASEEQFMNSKACAFCNRGMETKMMQGSLVRYDPSPGFDPFQLHYKQSPRDKIPDIHEEPTFTVRRGPGRPPFKGRKKGTILNGFSVISSNPKLPLDMILFGTSQERDIDELFEATGHTWCHSCCALWSEGVQQNETSVENVDKAVFQAMTQKCDHCNNYGASVACNDESCTKKFHYTCASSAGCFQEIRSKSVFCTDHTDQAEKLVGEEAKCTVCDEVGDLTKQLFCCNCWRHYHGNCLQPKVDVLPSSRMAWHCPVCKICIDCGSSGDDSKMLVCDICDKGYHMYCMKPPVVTLPKDGWKCESCRRCQDCGSSTPGSGATSRWHFNYTVCDSCYQQRNKGLSCPLCGRAYRHFSDIPMIQCKKCEKCVHRECDQDHADMVPYRCANCRVPYKHESTINNDVENVTLLSSNQLAGNEDMLSSISDHNLSLDISININLDECNELDDSYDLGEKLPFDEEMEVELKEDEFSSAPQFSDSLSISTVPIAKKTAVSAGKQAAKRKLSRRPRQSGGAGRKRGKTGKPGSKLKNKAIPTQSLPDKENMPDVANNQEDPSKHPGESLKSCLVLFSTDDHRMKTQDMCRCCGSFGQGVEGHLIPCSQCGQSYHPYCVNVKINKVIITKGWRCLDCTLCEGCGKGSDEARLLLCDSCDISYHTYCLDPPLDHVPHGGWKCKWCVVCTLCSRTTPGKSCKWMSNYTLCGPCASLTTCPICKTLYKVDDLMIQCVECERWLHAYCDQFTKEEDVERAADAGYKCYFCRPKSQSFFSITSTSTMTSTSRWSQSINTLSCVSSYAFGTFGPSSPKATSVQHYHPGPGRKPLHPVQRHGSKGTVEMSLASRIALGNTGESCSPAAIFLTESGEKHISESKRHHNKVVKKRRNKLKKGDQIGGKNAGSNVVERSSLQTARIGLEHHHGGEKDGWPARSSFTKKPETKRRDMTKIIASTAAKDDQLQRVQENFFGRSLLMSTSAISENIPRSQDSPSINVAQDEITEPVNEAVNSVSWSLAPHPTVTPAPQVQDTIETLPAAPDLNLPDPDVLVNQLGMLVTAAEGESLRNEPRTNQDGRLTTDTRTDYTGGSVVSSRNSNSQESVHSLNTEQRRQPSHDLDILVPQSGDLPMVDSQDIEDFFSGIENELSQRPTGLISDPLLSSVGVHVTPNPVPQRPPPPPYSSAARTQYPREIHSHAWSTVSVGEPPPYQAPQQDRVQTNLDMVHSAANGARVEPEFEHINDDFGPRRPRPESPRADSHRQLLKWQEDEKLGAMATISPVLYANLNYPNLRDEYPEWVPRYRAMARLWRKLRTEEREPYRHKARDNRVKLKDQMKRNGASKFASAKEPDMSSNNPQLPSEAQAVNGLSIEHQTAFSSKVENETPYPGMVVTNHQINSNSHVNIVNNSDKSQSMQSKQQHNAQYSFPKHPFQQNESVMNLAASQPVAEKQLMSSQGSHILTSDVSKKERTPKKYRGDRDKEKELKDKKNQIWQEREREWKLLQQQRQQENRKQQQQNQDSYPMRKDVRGKQSKTPDWRKTTTPRDENTNNLVTEQHGQTVAASSNDNTIQIQLSNYISSSQPSRVDEQVRHPSVMSVPQAERAVENSQSTPSFQIQTVAVTTSTPSVENSTTFWSQDTPPDSGSSLQRTPSRTTSTEVQHQNWMGQHEEQQQHTQRSMQLPRQMSEHELQQEQHQPVQQEPSSFQHQSALPLNVVQVPVPTPISSEHEPHRPMSRDPSVHPSVTQHLAMTRLDLSAAQSKQSDNTFLEQTPRQKQQEALTQKQQQVQQLQKQQQLQQQEVLQREQRKQLALAQHQQQGFIQMQLKHHRFPSQQPYATPQPPRQANQFTANSKEMPEIDTEEEHQERLQFLYRQRQMQKQLQARQYMMQPPTPAPSNMWVNNPQVMQGLSQNVPSDPIQQRLFLEQQRPSQRLDLQRGNMEKLPHHISSAYNTTPTPVVDATQKFIFHQQTKNGQNDSEFLATPQVTHTQVSISTYSTQAGVTGHTTTAAIFSEIAAAKSDNRKSTRKDRRNSTIDLSSHSGHFGAGFPNAVEPEPQRDGSALSHSGNNKNELLTVSQETCITVDEGNVRRVDAADTGFATDNDKKEQSVGEDLNGKSLLLPYGTPNSALQNNPANPQLVVPPPQLSLSPQQQHMLLQAQQQQLLWQQAHSQLQHQYQLLYQQLQQLQIQLQQTQDPALHQQVLGNQQQLRFLQTQILRHWQQGQIVVQQIHLQAFGVNAMFNQMDPTQQKHMQIYQQELVRQQQQWAQQFSGVADIFGRVPGMPQDNRPPAVEEKPKRSRRSRSKAKNPPKESQQTGANTPEANTGSVPNAETTAPQLSSVSQNVKEDEESSKDQERQSETFHGTELQAHQLHRQEKLQRQQLEHQQINEQEHQPQLSHQPEQQQRRPTIHEQQHSSQPLEQQQSHQEQIQLIQQQQHFQQQILQQEQHSQQQLSQQEQQLQLAQQQQQAHHQSQSQPSLMEQQQLSQQEQQTQLAQQQQQAHHQSQSQPSLMEQQQLRQQQNRQPYQDMFTQQPRQPEQLQVHQHQELPQNVQQLGEQATQPVVERMQLQLQHRPYETQHRCQPTTAQQQTLTPFQQPPHQGSTERQPCRTHGDISSAVSHSDMSRDHPQAVLGRRPVEDGRPKLERRASVGTFRPEHHESLQSPLPQRNLLSSSATVTTSQSKINITLTDTATKETEDKNQAPKALEKLEMMVAVMDVEAKRTEAETARRAEDMQNEEFLSETLDVVNVSSNESLQISHSLPNDVVATGNYGVKQTLLTGIHKSTQPETVKNELVQNNLCVEENVPEEMLFKDCPDSLKGSAATNELTANTECSGPENKTNNASRPQMKDELQKQESLEMLKPDVEKKEQDEQLRMKRQLQIEERDGKLSDRKRMKNLHSDRKQSKKETTRNKTTKSKKFKLTDEAIVQSLKELPPLQLCEPEFLMPSLIIQPTLNGLYHGQTVFRGSFGRSYITDVDDYYANKKFPDIKVCINNPPTPPTSLPPSPTFTHSKEQRLYDMLVERTQHSTSMFPTPPYGDSVVDIKSSLPKEKPTDRSQRQKLGMFQDHSRTLPGHLAAPNAQHEIYPAFVIDKGLSVRSKPENSIQHDSDVNKIYSDVNVTLTIAAISDKTVHETVNAISELIDVDIPTKLTIGSSVRHASAVYLDTNERIGNPRFLAGNNVDEGIVSGNSDVKKSQSGNGPYCRHCDVVILGIGVVRNNSANGTKEGLNDDKTSNYCNINVEDGVNDGRDIFCSSACLKQYYSLDSSETSSVSKESSSTASTPEEELKTKGLTTSYKLVNDASTAVRGDEVAEETLRVSLGKPQQKSLSEENEVDEKRSKRSQWRRWKDAPSAPSKANELTDDEIFQLLVKHGMAKETLALEKDRRHCVLCYQSGDGETNGTARLLNVDLDAWVHLNCALWSYEVYETQNGALMNVGDAIKRGEKTECVVCHGKGATILCNKRIGACLVNCSNSYHFQCARDNGCLFFKDKTVLCPKHQSDHLEDNILPSHAVFRKVFVNRQEIEQIAKMLSCNQTSEKPYSFRIGNLILNSIGQLLPHQVQAFHTRDSVYPVGFSTTRIYWSMRVVGRRCRYQCHVKDVNGDPHFVVKVEEEGYEEVSFDARTPRDAWLKILEPVEGQRKDTNRVNLFPGYITGEDLFGLSEPLIVRIVESMPGVDQMQGYNMRYGRSPTMELPLAINPSGCARSEPLLRTHFKRPARARRQTKNASSATTVVVPPEELNNSVYSKQFAHSKTQQYRKLKSEWRSNVLLGRSRIQGLGLFANRDLEGNNMVIEYIGSIIRNEVANKRERIYESQNHGVYMFRIDNDSVIDATIAGGPARYINHSCQPNCVAEVVRFEREQKIIIISNRRIEKGEELTYDYKFDFEDDQHKIPCLCGAVNCRKWMN